MHQSLRFAHFELRPLERLLLAGGEPVAIGSRAFDVLRELVAQPGELVRKDVLIERVWPGLVVEENNLQVQISALRRALGVRAIATIPGQGYRFALPVAVAQAAASADAAGHARPPPQAAPQGVAQRRSVTALHARLEGVQPLLDREGPEALDELLGELQAAAGEILDNRGGVLAAFDMLGWRGLFGLPAAQEDDVLQAVEAALELAARVQRLGHRHGIAPGLRIGVAHGSVVASPAAPPAGWRIAGALPPLAAALAEAASPHEVLVCAETQRLLSPYFELLPVPARVPVSRQPAAGAARPAAFRVGPRSGADSRLGAAMARGFTPLVGRDEELATLRRQLDEAIAGAGRAINVVADAGFGKSRLVHEFRSRIADGEATVLQTRCSPQGRLGAYLPFVDALRHVLQLGSVPAEAREAHAVHALRAIDPQLEPWLPHLLHLLSIPSATHALPETLEGAARRAALAQALVAAITVAAASAPLVMVFDDWHWADEASGEVLDQLVEVVASHRLLIVVTARPQTALGWSRHVHCSQLGLRPLSRVQTEAVVLAACAASAVPAPVADAIHARSEGNPFFIEELCRTLLDLGHLGLDGAGALAARRPLDGIDLPSTIEAVIQARLDRLPPEARELARLAAVIGREFSRADLEALSAEPAGVADALALLSRAALIHPTRVVPEAVFRFRHALSQVVAYDSLLVRHRRELHERVGLLLEARHEGRHDEHAEALAYHFVNGLDRGKAIAHSWRAGAKAAHRAAHGLAVRHLQSAAELLEQAAQAHAASPAGSRDPRDDGIPDERLLDTYVALGHSLTLLHGYAEPRLVRTCERARELSRAGGPVASRFAATWMLWRYYYNRAQIHEAEAMALQLTGLAQAGGERSRLLAACTATGIVAYFRGRYVEARQTLENALAAHEPATEAPLAVAYGASPTVMAGSFLANTLSLLGDAAGAERAGLAAQRLSVNIAHPGSEAFATFYLSANYLMHGFASQALREAEALAALSQRHGFAHWLALSRVNTSAVAMMADPAQAAAAMAQFHAAGQAVMAFGVLLMRVPFHLALMRASLRMGQLDAARSHWQAADEAARSGGLATFEAMIESGRACVLMATDHDAALDAFGRALAIAKERQSAMHQIDIALELAQSLRHAGRLDAARRLLAPSLAAIRGAAPTPIARRLQELVAAQAPSG